MADQDNGTTIDTAPVANGEDNMPAAGLISQYVKDLSFENPNAPAIFQNPNPPAIDVQFNIGTAQVGEEVHEVVLKIDVKADADGQTAFIVDLTYAGLFGLRNVPADAIQPFLLGEAPRLLFPFARRVLADCVRDGGFPPLLLEPIDFGQLYLQQAEQNGGGAFSVGDVGPRLTDDGGRARVNLTKALGSVGGLTLASRVLALVRDTLQATYVGAGFASDAFFVAFRLPNMFRALFAEGAFSAAFIPLFNRKVADGGGTAAGVDFAERALAVLFPVLLVFTLAMLAAADPITWGLSGGFERQHPTPDQFAFAVTLSRFTIPYLMLISLVSLLGGILNSLNRFWVNAAAPILLNVAMVGALVLFHGGDAYATARVQALSVTAGGVLQLAWLWWACRRAGVKLALRRPRIDADVKRMLTLIVPAAAGAGAAQINLAVSTALAGKLLAAGSISAIYYADRLNQLPLGLIGIGLGTILLPVVSRLLSEGREAEAMETQNRGLELALFLTLPATAAFVFAAEPIVRGLFQHGAFDASDTVRASQALAAFSLGLPSYVLVKVLTPGFYARADTRTPVRLALYSVAINLVGNLILIPTLARWNIGQVGPPLATALASTVNVIALYVVLARRGHFRIDPLVRRKVPRLALAAALMGAALLLVTPLVEPYLTRSLLVRGAALTVLVGSGVAIYVLACFVTGAFRVTDLRSLLRRKATSR